MRRSLEAPSTAVGAVAWPQRYAQLLDAHTRLQQTLAAQEAAHRRARTAVKYDPALPNNDKFTRELLEQNHELTQRCRTLELRLAKLDGARASTVSLSPRRSERRSRKPARRVTHASVQTIARDVDNTERGEDDDGANASASERTDVLGQSDGAVNTKPASDLPEQVQTLVTALKQRLAELAVDVARLQQENELLRAEKTTKPSEGNDRDPYVKHGELRTRPQQQELEHLFCDRVRQMEILEEQFVHLHHKVKTKTLLYSESLERVEQLTSELFDAQQTLLKQAEWLHAQQDANAQLRLLEKEVHVLRSENTTLNETIAVLSARPLDALNIQLEKKAIQISLLEEANAKLGRELHHASQDHRVVMQTNDKLRVRVETLSKQLEASLAESQALKAERERLVGEREIAQLQLQFYLSGESMESKELMEAVGRALKLMRAEQGNQPLGGTTAKAHTTGDSTNEGSALQRERADKMALVTKLIQEETRAQLQDLKIAHQAEIRDLKRQSARWQQRANEYLREITTLRRESRAIVGKPKPPTRRLDCSDVRVVSTRDPWLATSPRKEQYASEENLLEVRVFDLRFHGGCAHNTQPERRSFAVFCDYFDFESQHSPMFPLDPESHAPDVAPVDMEVSYKLLVDPAFCRSPVSQSLTVELHRLEMASAAVVGAAVVSLHALFLSERGYVAMSVKLLDPTSRAGVGSFRLVASLARPTHHLYKSTLAHGRPMPPLALSTRAASNAATLHLEIRVIAVVMTNDTTVDGAHGHASVRYRFMGNAPVRYTTQERPTVSHGFNAQIIDRTKAFEIPGDDQMLAFLERYQMVVATQSPSGHVRGEAQVPFQSVAQSFRTNRCGNSIISTVLTIADDAVEGAGGAVGPVGRVWLELQALDVKAMEALSPASLRGPVERVLGDGSQLDWHRFCEVMSLAAPERAVRQLLAEKSQANGAMPGKEKTQALVQRIKNTSPDMEDALSTVFQQAGLQCSRSELSFIRSALFAHAFADIDDDEAEFHRRQHTKGFKRLRLLVETIDSEWLRMEPLLRAHSEVLGVLAEHAPTETQWITWDKFVHRIRLIA